MASNNYDWHLPETDIRDVGKIVTCGIEHLLEAVDSSSAQAGELDLYFRGPDYAKNGKKIVIKGTTILGDEEIPKQLQQAGNKLSPNNSNRSPNSA